MKRIKYIIVLVVCMIVGVGEVCAITGTMDWSDVSGFTCDYSTTNSSSSISEFTIQTSSSGISINFNDGNGYVSIVNSSGDIGSASTNGTNVSFSPFVNYENSNYDQYYYISSYVSRSSCGSMYMYYQTGQESVYYLSPISVSGRNLTIITFSGSSLSNGTTDEEVLGAVKYEYNSGSVCSAQVCDTKGNCDANGVLKAMQIVGYVIYIIKILVPIILIIMGMVDLTKGVIANDNKASSEVIMAFVRRIAVAVIIFLIPSILSFLLDLVYGVQETMTDSSAQIENCTNCLLHPLDSDTCLAEDFIQE